jgi:tetratricopeptide (TPR) repeat protein
MSKLAPTSPPPTPAERDGLEAERDFLLRSLDDLEAEREAGNIDDDTYAVLHGDYTARAAAVLRALEQGTVPDTPKAPPVSARRKVLAGTALLVCALVAGLALASAVGNREPGQTITGNQAASDAREGNAGGLDRLAAAAEASPDDYGARIAYARALLGERPADAVREYRAAQDLEPDEPEPPTYIGWISSLVAQQLGTGDQRDQLLQDALRYFAHAVRLDQDYPDVYVFRGLTYYNALADPARAAPDFQLFLAKAPQDHPMRSTVQSALQRALAEARRAEPAPSSTAP